MPSAFSPNDYADHPRLSPSGGGQPKLRLSVIFTTPTATRATLAAASEYARELGAQITILVAQVVPYPLPLECPPVAAEFTARMLQSIAAGQTVETAVEIYLCRDRWETIRQSLKPESAVVLGGRKRWWWPTPEQRLAAALRRDGHRVVLVDPDRPSPAVRSCESSLDQGALCKEVTHKSE